MEMRLSKHCVATISAELGAWKMIEGVRANAFTQLHVSDLRLVEGLRIRKERFLDNAVVCRLSLVPRLNSS